MEKRKLTEEDKNLIDAFCCAVQLEIKKERDILIREAERSAFGAIVSGSESSKEDCLRKVKESDMLSTAVDRMYKVRNESYKLGEI